MPTRYGHPDLAFPLAMYQYYQIMICLLKFDFAAFVGVTMQVWRCWQPLWMRLLTEVLLHLALDRGTSDEYS